MAKQVIDDPELGELTDDRLTGGYRIFQRRWGHRFSVDDVATAYIAWRAAPEARTILDLGCGIGSVLLHHAWKFPLASLVGIEAQAISFAILQRNIARNDLGSRVAIRHGDLRELEMETRFDLITGTPPYFPVDAAVDAVDEQRAYARIEYRGGVEAYLEAAGRLLTGAGTVVLCGEANAGERVATGAKSAGLSIRARCDIVPREGRKPLFSVWTATRGLSSRPEEVSALVIRDAAGVRTTDATMLTAFSGF